MSTPERRWMSFPEGKMMTDDEKREREVVWFQKRILITERQLKQLREDAWLAAVALERLQIQLRNLKRKK